MRSDDRRGGLVIVGWFLGAVALLAMAGLLGWWYFYWNFTPDTERVLLFTTRRRWRPSFGSRRMSVTSHHAITIVLDLANPVRTRRRLVGG